MMGKCATSSFFFDMSGMMMSNVNSERHSVIVGEVDVFVISKKLLPSGT